MEKDTSHEKRVTGRQAYADACLLLENKGPSGEAAGREALELLAYCCQKTKLKLLLGIDEPLDLAVVDRYRALVARRIDHEPMAYLTGSVDFGGREFSVARGVLIPRDDTMVLVRHTVARLDEKEPYRVLELGCGSGAIIVTLALERPLIRCLAVDIADLAVEVTKENVSRYGIAERVQVIQGDWFTPVSSRDTFDAILSNPPYISSQEMQGLPESVKKEPELALLGGEDGLACYRKLIPEALDKLKPGGWLLMEIGWKQGRAVKALFEIAGYSDVSVYHDEAGRDRVVAGCRKRGADSGSGFVRGEPPMRTTDTGKHMVDDIPPMGTAVYTQDDAWTEAKKATRHWTVNGPDDPRIVEAGRLIRAGGLVAFPTETVYGLGANGLNEEAVAGIYAAKGRPADNPLILHVASTEEAQALTTDWNDRASRLADAFWPGPLTMVLPAAAHIPNIVTAGLDTVAIRYPSDPIARALIKASGVPVAAPSANASGRPSPTRAEHVLEDMACKIDALIDHGPCKVGLESTIIDLSVEPPAILRPGDVTLEAIRLVIGEVQAGEGLAEESQPDKNLSEESSADGVGGHAEDNAYTPKAPGMKYRHYAPSAPVAILRGTPQAIAHYVAEFLLRGPIIDGESNGETQKPDMLRQKAGLLLSEETWRFLEDKGILPDGTGVYYGRTMGSYDKPWEMGAVLYDALRACDREEVSQIYVEACNPEGQGAAVLNRLRKAAGGVLIQVPRAL